MATFGADTLGFGTLAGWAIQTSNATDENKRANTLGPLGNEKASNLFDDTQQVNTTYKADQVAAPTIPASIGGDVNGVALTGIALSTDAEDFVTMTLTGHAHSDGSHGVVKSVAHGITLDAGFGASAFGCTVGVGNSVRSSECNITAEHIDVPDQDGDTTAGENYDAKIEVSARILGAGASVPAAYDRLEDGTEGENTDFQYQTLRGIKPLDFDAGT